MGKAVLNSVLCIKNTDGAKPNGASRFSQTAFPDLRAPSIVYDPAKKFRVILDSNI